MPRRCCQQLFIIITRDYQLTCHNPSKPQHLLKSNQFLYKDSMLDHHKVLTSSMSIISYLHVTCVYLFNVPCLQSNCLVVFCLFCKSLNRSAVSFLTTVSFENKEICIIIVCMKFSFLPGQLIKFITCNDLFSLLKRKTLLILFC